MFSRLLKQSSKRFYSTVSGLHRAVIVSAVRTPIGSFNGSLASFSAPKLGSLAIKTAIDRAGISNSDVQEVLMGNVCTAGVGQAPATQAALGAGLSDKTPCTVLNKVCASGMKSVMYAAQTIMTGQLECIVAGGMESMSNIPYYLPKARFGYRMGNGTVEDGMIKDGLTDAFSGKHMGLCGDACAKEYGFSREDQDKYAIESYKRAEQATKQGKFQNEIFSIAIPNPKNPKDIKYVTEDEEYKNIKLEKVPQLKPAFDKQGTITAANASKISDGAAALVIMSEEKAKRAGLTPIARILGYGDAARAPEEFTVAPSDAIPRALKHAGVNQSNVQFWEINEAFAVVAMVNAKLLNLDLNTVNVNGGAVALGHPIGCSGARIIVTLINVLAQNNANIGCAAICNGGGGASAIVIEKL